MRALNRAVVAIFGLAFAAVVGCDPVIAATAGKARPYGREGDPRKVKRVIKIDMSDAMRFFPDQIRVKRGDTVRFALRNSGQMPHAMVIGTMDELKQKAAAAKKNAETAERDAEAVHVEPGGTGRLVWHFPRTGEFYFACLVPGHYDAGMIGTIVVR